MGEVFLALPDHLDRRVGQLHRDLYRLGDIVILKTSSKAAAGHQHMHMDVIAIQPRQPRHVGFDKAGDLRAGPNIKASIGQLDHDAHRFHRGVGQIGDAVFRLDN